MLAEGLGVWSRQLIHLGLARVLDVGNSNCVLSPGPNAEDLDPNQIAPALTCLQGKYHLTRALGHWLPP